MRIRHYSLAKLFLKRILTTLRVCALCFFFLLILPFTDQLFEQYAMAAIQGDRTLTDADGADFSQSMMLGPDHNIREGDTIDYELILRNTGSKRPDYVELWNRVKEPSAMLASAPELSYDVEKRELYWRGTVDPGEERRFALRLVTIPKSAGTFISNHASIVWGTWVTNNGSFWDIKRMDIQCDPLELRSKEKNARVLFTVAGIELGWLEVLILGYFAFAPLFLIVVSRLIRWRERQRFESSPDVSWSDSDPYHIMVYAMSIAFLACLAIMLFFSYLVFEDIRKFSSYEKTTCIIVDKKLSWSSGSSGKTKSRIYDPLVSVRYEAKGNEIVSAGSIVKGTFSGRESSAEKKIAQYDLGRSYPCWFDPEDTREFLLERGLSWGWYLLCLGPLILFGIATRYLLRLRGTDTPSDISKVPIQPG
jgi:hypothetical protein